MWEGGERERERESQEKGRGDGMKGRLYCNMLQTSGGEGAGNLSGGGGGVVPLRKEDWSKRK